MEESCVLRVFRDLPCAELVKADIDVTEHLIRFECYDSRRRLCSGSYQLQPDDIQALSDGGLIILRDQSGREFTLRL